MEREDYEMLKEKYCEELSELMDEEITMSNLEIIHKLTDTIKNIEKIMSMEGQGSSKYSRYDGNVNTTNSMRGMSRRNYSYDDGNMESSRRYSRAGDTAIQSMQKLLNDNRLNTEEKKNLRHMIEEIKGEY